MIRPRLLAALVLVAVLPLFLAFCHSCIAQEPGSAEEALEPTVTQADTVAVMERALEGKLHELVLGKTYAFRGKARLLRAKTHDGDKRLELLKPARQDCEKSKTILQELKVVDLSATAEAERWLREIEALIAEIDNELRQLGEEPGADAEGETQD